MTNSAITVTFWRSYSRGRKSKYAWREFIDTFIAEPEIARDKETVAGFSLGLFDGNRRSLSRCKHVHALVLDFDQGDTTVDQAMALFPGVWRIAYTTYRHTPEYPKIRVVFPLARDVDADEYERLWIWAERKVKPHVCDESARDASRFWYLPSHPPGATYEWREGIGTPLDPEPALKEVAPLSRPVPMGRSPGGLPPTGNGRGGRAPLEDLAEDSFFGRAFMIAGLSFPTLPEGALPVVCPWADKHTSGYDGDTSTVILRATSDAGIGCFKCYHAHCAHRLTLDLLDVLPVKALDGARAAHGRGLVRVRVVGGWFQHLEAKPGAAAIDRFILKCRPRENPSLTITVKEQSSMHVKYLDGLPLQLLIGRRIDLWLEGRIVRSARLVPSELNMTSAEKRSRALAILAAGKPGDYIEGPDFDFLFALLCQHPRLEEKVGPGVRRIRIRADGNFEVVRVDGSCVDFGLKRSPATSSDAAATSTS